jgi:hypothetical protein
MPFGMLSRIDQGILAMKAFYENQETGAFIEEMVTGNSEEPLLLAKKLVDRLLMRLKSR